ncbi:iron transporter [Acinetobacter calcoaceticus]|uniref:iron transporter n=1 Tax=Acinetobacter TaxID=469 RepID=UPI002B29FB44|nr:iron transporter [Acinetobacter baumannii]
MTIEASVSLVSNTSAVKKKVEQASMIKYRLMIFSRFILAIVGGYYFAAIAAMLIGFLFSSEPSRANAVFSATMLAFVVHCILFIWIFMVKSTLKVWLGVIIPSLIMTLMYGLLKG